MRMAVRIDSDTHFTLLDAFDAVQAQYPGQVLRFVKLLSGRYRLDNPARAPLDIPASNN